MTSALERAVKASGSDAVLDALSEQEKAALRYMWHLHARASQLPPDGDWLTWLVLTGRGWGYAFYVEVGARGRPGRNMLRNAADKNYPRLEGTIAKRLRR